ncbi:MAG: type II secretion system protein [Candidatus Uhrbacteria bacterium]|nr:type II secretion system protein [Candidatus Uhrbacteria bacterium]
MKRLSNKKGFTLVETVLYIAILAVFLVSAVQFSLSIIASAQKVRTLHEVEQNARFAIERIRKEIRTADNINIGSSTFGSSPGVLSLVDDDPTNDPTTFDVSAGTLRITQGAGSATALTSSTVNVSNLVFTDLSVSGRTRNIKIELTVEWANTSSTEYSTSVSRTTSVVVREEED